MHPTHPRDFLRTCCWFLIVLSPLYTVLSLIALKRGTNVPLLIWAKIQVSPWISLIVCIVVFVLSIVGLRTVRTPEQKDRDDDIGPF